MAGSRRLTIELASCRTEPTGVGGGGGDARGDTDADEGALLDVFRCTDFGGILCTGNDGEAKYMVQQFLTPVRLLQGSGRRLSACLAGQIVPLPS